MNRDITQLLKIYKYCKFNLRIFVKLFLLKSFTFYLIDVINRLLFLVLSVTCIFIMKHQYNTLQYITYNDIQY